MRGRAPQRQTRTREDKAKALCSRLILATPARVAELLGEHTVESFAREHGVTPAMIRATFEEAQRRQQA